MTFEFTAQLLVKPGVGEGWQPRKELFPIRPRGRPPGEQGLVSRSGNAGGMHVCTPVYTGLDSLQDGDRQCVSWIQLRGDTATYLARDSLLDKKRRCYKAGATRRVSVWKGRAGCPVIEIHQRFCLNVF